MDVTVIVAVYNPGPFIEPCIESLLGQSLPDDSYELIFVDDGSTDETPQRLDAVAASHPNVIVRHEPNSGWSGRPRNVGLDLARGDYVFFCDHDDWLSPEALERMVRYARETGADVVAPKIIGHQRGSPTILFERNVPDAAFDTTPLMFALAPHKLFRRAFLDERKLRFREGRRFEDQVFVLDAYLQASRIAVLADYECYHHVLRSDDANAAFFAVDPDDYVRNVAEVIDVIESRTEPGPIRDLVMRRPFELELLGRFAQRWFVDSPADYQRDLLVAVSRLLNDRFPADFGERYGVVTRARAAAVRAGDFDAVRSLSARTASLKGRAELVDLTWDGEAWRAEVEAEVVFDDGLPVALTSAGEDAWRVDPRLLVDGMQTRPDSTAELLTARATVEVIGQATAVSWFADGDLGAELRPVEGRPDERRLWLRGSIRLDPAILAGGRPLAEDSWRVRVRIFAFGHNVTTRLQRGTARANRLRPAIVGAPAVTTAAVFKARDEHLTLQVRPTTRAVLGDLLRDAVTAARVTDRDLELDLDVNIAAGVEPLPLRLQLRGGDRRRAPLDGTLVRVSTGGVLRAATSITVPTGSDPLPAGRFRLVVPSRSPAALGAHVVVSDAGTITAAGLGAADADETSPAETGIGSALGRRLRTAFEYRRR